MMDEKPEELAKHVHTLTHLKGCHFCFFAKGPADDDMDRINSTLFYLYVWMRHRPCQQGHCLGI
jgi:hypothetical protein